jgi:hypothetical protein
MSGAQLTDAVAQGQSPGDTGAVLAADLPQQTQAQNPLDDPEYVALLRDNPNSL